MAKKLTQRRRKCNWSILPKVITMAEQFSERTGRRSTSNAVEWLIQTHPEVTGKQDTKL
jgi:hypothetical protein